MENQEEERVSRMRGRHMTKARGAARHHDMRDDSVAAEPRQIVDRPQQSSEPVEVISPEGVLNLKALKRAKVTDLAQIARDFEVEGAVNMRKQEMIFAVLQAQAHRNGAIRQCGNLDAVTTGVAEAALAPLDRAEFAGLHAIPDLHVHS